jgi:pimeloyl-ACP methyl ester carboxylesterase
MNMLSRVALAPFTLSFASADDLRRHTAIGLSVEKADRGVAVLKAIKGGAGAEAGIRTGDLIATLDGKAMGSTGDFVSAIGSRLGGEAVELGILRAGQPLTQKVMLKPRGYETSPYADILYESVTVQGALRRTILSRPKGPGRHPAIVLMGGLGCYSVDNQDPTNGYGRILAEFQRKNYVTLRVEKPGQGDSQGPACTDPSATPQREADGYVAGIRALKRRDFVDPDRIFVFAHSLGPVIGSLALPQERVAGFVAVETVGTSWYEYDIERVRLQESLSDKPHDEVERSIREYEACSHQFFVEKVKAEELVKRPGCARVLAPLASVPSTYMQAVQDINLAAQWKHLDVPVLVVHGTSSSATTARQNQYLAETINRLHPGRATHVEVAGMGHDLARYESMRDYHFHFQEPHPFHTGILDAVMPWVEAVR